MFKTYISIILILCCVSVLTFILLHSQAKSKQQLLKVYKYVPYSSKQVSVDGKEKIDMSADFKLSETRYSNEKITDVSTDTSLSTIVSTVDEESVTLQQTSLIGENMSNKTDVLELETENTKKTENTIEELTPQEENRIINEMFPLISVLDSYGVDTNLGGVRCPLCGHPDDFVITRDKNTWWCETCSNTAHDNIEFVAKIEGIPRDEARRHLLKMAGFGK